MAHFADAAPDSILTAREISQRSSLPLPTVSKVLKLLTRASLVVSSRGVNGGYTLARVPKSIRVSEMIDALEGPTAMTECAHGQTTCEFQSQCLAKEPWQKINRVVRKALAALSLADMAKSGVLNGIE